MIFSLSSETLASVLQASWSYLKREAEQRACAPFLGLKRATQKHPGDIKMPLNQSDSKTLAHCCAVLKTFCLWRKGWGGGKGRHWQRTRKICEDNAPGDKVRYSRRAPLNLFERPLRHLGAGSSIARSGPTLNPLPAAWNGWQQIPALRLLLSKRNGRREGQGETRG